MRRVKGKQLKKIELQISDQYIYIKYTQNVTWVLRQRGIFHAAPVREMRVPVCESWGTRNGQRCDRGVT